MGRTLATSTQIILNEQQAFTNFRKALSLQDRQAFDALFAGARKHTPAISMTAHALPFETVLLAMLLEEHRHQQHLQEMVDLQEKHAGVLLSKLSTLFSLDEQSDLVDDSGSCL